MRTVQRRLEGAVYVFLVCAREVLVRRMWCELQFALLYHPASERRELLEASVRGGIPRVGEAGMRSRAQL